MKGRTLEKEMETALEESASTVRGFITAHFDSSLLLLRQTVIEQRQHQL